MLQPDGLVVRCRWPFRWVGSSVSYRDILEAYPLKGIWAPGVGLKRENGAEIHVFTSWQQHRLLEALADRGVRIA